MTNAQQAAHSRQAVEYDRLALTARTRRESASYRRLAREHRLAALLAAYRTGARTVNRRRYRALTAEMPTPTRARYARGDEAKRRRSPAAWLEALFRHR